MHRAKKERDSLYLGALLHDICRFIERSKRSDFQELPKGEAFLDYVPVPTKGILLKLIRIADDCASAERREDTSLNPQQYYLARLQSIFSEISLERGGTMKSAPRTLHLALEALSIKKSALFSLHESPAFENTAPLPYAGLVESFLQDFPSIRNGEELLFLLQKYLSCVPAQTPVEFKGESRLTRHDISLFLPPEGYGSHCPLPV